jgi:hypothetical protein
METPQHVFVIGHDLSRLKVNLPRFRRAARKLEHVTKVEEYETVARALQQGFSIGFLGVLEHP